MEIITHIDHLIILGFSVFIFLLGISSIYNRKSNGTNGVSALVLKIDEKDKLIAGYEEEIAKRDIMINRQDREIISYVNRIHYLEAMLEDRDMDKEKMNYARPDLLLVTTVDDIQQTDEISLNRAGVNYRRLSKADKTALDDELRRRRQEDALYKYIVFSGHMSDEGMYMADGDILDSYWLNSNLAGVKLVILNGCESTTIASDLVGVVDYVISMSEKIPNKVAGGFLWAFWNAMKEEKSIPGAFGIAKAYEPSAAPYIDLLIKH